MDEIQINGGSDVTTSTRRSRLLSSGATYCVCKDGVSDQALQKILDYACGARADCQAQGSCDFSGIATVSANPPSDVASTCSYLSRYSRHSRYELDFAFRSKFTLNKRHTFNLN
ncbi:hypothetical protein PTKIN_Ptkin16aG0023700 [Pterospermum kingtungense]